EETHNPIELHATVAQWSGKGADESVTIYETSQAIATHRNVIAQILGVPKENVRVITKFLGSGFGGKLWPWTHSALAAQTARLIKRPVKLVIDRHMAFTNVGHRPRTQQHIKISADEKGNFTSLTHDYATQGAMFGDYKENCGEVTGFLYKCPNVMVTSGVARRNQPVPTSMRGPGAVPGLFALESSIDELAVELGMDPVELRILNDVQEDQVSGNPFSSRKFKECLELGSSKFGWSKRSAKPGSMKQGEEVLGWGVAACTWQAKKVPTEALVEFTEQGRIRVKSATHDIGTGMYTAIAQIVSELAGVPLNIIDVEIGDTDLPPGALAGGSMATGSMISALSQAVKKATANLTGGAAATPSSPFYGQKPEALQYMKGKVSGPKGGSVSFGELVRKMNMSSVAGKGVEPGNFGADEKKAKFSTKSFGAHFVEVAWNPGLARLRVSRVV
ncbi:MAG: xanthine dehydrogenase family protein molybdopterin-binding subunit, partial [Proteobacteria bacterium]